MLNDSKQKSYLVLTALAVLVLGAAGWYLAGKTLHARADVLDVRDVSDVGDPARPAHAGRRATPLASIPWKRTPDALSPAVVDAARLPWLRESDRPAPVALNCANVPWSRQINSAAKGDRRLAADVFLEAPAALPWDAQREVSYVPVFLPTSELPWRY